MLNQITICGRLTKDPELRYTQSQKPVASFTLACERDYAQSGEKRETDFVDCVAWNNTANFVDQYFSKGDMTIVIGRLQTRKWTDRDGNKRTAYEIIADRVYFGESKRKGQAESLAAEATAPGASAFLELNDTDGELPF